MTPRNLNHFFKDMSVKALGENRGGQLVFKDLRDSTTRPYWIVT